GKERAVGHLIAAAGVEAKVLWLLRRLGDRDDHTPAVGELLDKRRRHTLGRRSDKDRLVGRVWRPALAAVAHRDLDVAKTKAPERRRGVLRQSRLTLDADHLATEPAQHRGRIARAGPDLERDVIGLR